MKRRDVDPLVATLAAERHRRGWSLQQVADRAGVAKSSICHVESGHRQPTLPLLRAWADALDLDLAVAGRRPRRPAVVVSPALRWGQPCIGGISTEIIAEQVWAGLDVPGVAADYGLARVQVLLACWHQGVHCRQWRRRWGVWAGEVGPTLAAVVAEDQAVDAIPDPPTRDDRAG